MFNILRPAAPVPKENVKNAKPQFETPKTQKIDDQKSDHTKNRSPKIVFIAKLDAGITNTRKIAGSAVIPWGGWRHYLNVLVKKIKMLARLCQEYSLTYNLKVAWCKGM